MKKVILFLMIATSTVKTTGIFAQVNVRDSLVLVDLYNSTNGPGWSHKWVITSPVSAWYGVTITTASVTGLDLSNDSLAGTIPDSLGNLTSLKNLNLSHNQLSGGIPELSNGFVLSLKSIDLSYNQLSGRIPDGYNPNDPDENYLFALSSLNLSHNQLTGGIPELSNSFLQSLGSVDLSYNQLSGEIPYTLLGNIIFLNYLNLSHNQLTGTINNQGDLNLEYLNLSYNQLSGNIPVVLSENENMSVFDVSHNQLSGSISAEFGNSFTLGTLNLSYNQLSGSIPPELGYLETRIVDLSYNKLSGSIPVELGNFANDYNAGFQKLNLSYNQLSGIVPATLAKVFETYVSNGDTTSLDLDSNNLTFAGMDSLVDSLSDNTIFTYALQANIPVHINNSVLSVSAGGTLSNNTYKWYKDGLLFKTIKGDSLLTTTQAGKYYVAVTNSIATKLTLYSDTVDAAVLAASLLSFTAIKQPASVMLNWQTASEINTNYFNIQRSNDGIHFTIINKLMAEGNSNRIKNYSYTDDAVKSLNKSVLYYRIEEVDKDASGTFSMVRIINIKDNNTFTISPNPARDFITITSSDDIVNAQLSVTDISGKILYHVNHNFLSNEPLKIPVAQFADYMFIVVINTTSTHTSFKVLKN